jgi:hypothetical protein
MSCAAGAGFQTTALPYASGSDLAERYVDRVVPGGHRENHPDRPAADLGPAGRLGANLRACVAADRAQHLRGAHHFERAVAHRLADADGHRVGQARRFGLQPLREPLERGRALADLRTLPGRERVPAATGGAPGGVAVLRGRRSASQARQDPGNAQKPGGATLQIAAADHRMDRMVARRRVLRYPEVPAMPLVGIEDGLADAAVQVNPGQQDRVRPFGTEHSFEVLSLEGTEERLVEHELALLRLKLGRRCVPGGPLFAEPAILALPVRHPAIVGTGDRGPDVHNGNAALAAGAQQRSGPLDDGAGRGVEAGCAEVVALEVDQQQKRLHFSAAARHSAAAAPTRAVISSIPTAPPTSMVLAPSLQTRRTPCSSAL